jgi:hypothetical protein
MAAVELMNGGVYHVLVLVLIAAVICVCRRMDCDTLEIKRSSVKPAPYGKKCKSMLGK